MKKVTVVFNKNFQVNNPSTPKQRISISEENKSQVPPTWKPTFNLLKCQGLIQDFSQMQDDVFYSKCLFQKPNLSFNFVYSDPGFVLNLQWIIFIKHSIHVADIFSQRFSINRSFSDIMARELSFKVFLQNLHWDEIQVFTIWSTAIHNVPLIFLLCAEKSMLRYE